MSQQYAKDQPADFKNHIQNITLVGASGNLGSHILAALLAAGKHSITILTRPESTHTFPPGVTIKHIDYSSPTSLTTALHSQDVLIITLAVSAPPTVEPALIRAAAAAGVKYVMPNEWGQDFAHAGLRNDTPFLGPKLAATRKLLEEVGVDWLVVTSGFWYEYSLAGTEWRYGFDFKGRKVTFYGEGRQRVNTSTWEQIGRAVAGLLALRVLREDERDEEPTLEGFKNGQCYVSSFCVSQREMFESVLRVTGTRESEWEIGYEDVEERWRRGIEMFKGGDMTGFGLAMYARCFFADGAGDYQGRVGLSNGVLGLPEEDLDLSTKSAVERAEKLAGTY